MRLKVMTLNICGWFPGWPLKLLRLSRMIKSEQPDIVALQEVRGTSETETQAHQLAERCKYHVRFAPGHKVRDQVEGVAILSKAEPQDVFYKELYRNVQDPLYRYQRSLLGILASGVWFFSTHLSLSSRARNKVIYEVMTRCIRSEPSLLLGDLNATQCERLHTILREFGWHDLGGSATFPAVFPWRRLDYIYSNRIMSAQVRTINLGIFDHLAVLAEVETVPNR